MGLDLKALVQNVFTIVGSVVADVLVEATYQNFSSASYDTSAGESIKVYATTVVPDAIQVGYRNYEREQNPNIQSEDQKLLVAYAALSIEPTVEDLVTIAGKNWAVKDYRRDPSTSLWTFRIGSPGG